MKRVRITEDIALRAPRPPAVELGGAKLDRAVRLLDRNGVLQARAGVHTSFATDGTSVTMVVELADAAPLSFELHNCPEPHVCGFLRDAAAAGLVDHVPETCRMERPPCDRAKCEACLEVPVMPPRCGDELDPVPCDPPAACDPVPSGDGGVAKHCP